MMKKKPAGKKAGSKKKKVTIPDVKEVIQAPYRFTISEIGQMNIDLRIALNEIETLEEQMKAASQDFKLRIKNREIAAKQLRNRLDSGEETRPLEVRVDFEPKRNKKLYYHPTSGEFIREEDMQPADWQLPMFKKADDGTLVPAAGTPATPEPEKKGGKPAKAPKSSPAGSTNVGDVLDKTAALKDAPKIKLDLTVDWEHDKLTRAFKKAAKVAGWDAAQISAMKDRLRECDTVEKMVDTLRPHAENPAASDPTIL